MIAERFQKLLKALFFCPITKMLKAPSFEGAFLVSATPHIGKPKGRDAGNVMADALAESLDKPFPWAVGFFFADLELT